MWDRSRQTPLTCNQATIVWTHHIYCYHRYYNCSSYSATAPDVCSCKWLTSIHTRELQHNVTQFHILSSISLPYSHCLSFYWVTTHRHNIFEEVWYPPLNKWDNSYAIIMTSQNITQYATGILHIVKIQLKVASSTVGSNQWSNQRQQQEHQLPPGMSMSMHRFLKDQGIMRLWTQFIRCHHADCVPSQFFCLRFHSPCPVAGFFSYSGATCSSTRWLKWF